MKPLLLVVDMCQDFFKNNSKWKELNKGKKSQVKAINDLVKHFRSKGNPVVWVVQRFKKDLSDAHALVRENKIYETIEGTDGWKLLPELDREEDEVMIVKNRYSAFFKTRLEQDIEKNNIDTIVIVGVNTHACIRITAIDAYMRDHKVILVEEGINSTKPEFAKTTIEYLKTGLADVKSLEEVKKQL